MSWHFANEQVDVLNINTGARFTTYAISADRGSKTIGINGAAARLAQPDDLVIILAYAQMDEAAARAQSRGLSCRKRLKRFLGACSSVG